jgi:hypothetical protein
VQDGSDLPNTTEDRLLNTEDIRPKRDQTKREPPKRESPKRELSVETANSSLEDTLNTEELTTDLNLT